MVLLRIFKIFYWLQCNLEQAFGLDKNIILQIKIAFGLRFFFLLCSTNLTFFFRIWFSLLICINYHCFRHELLFDIQAHQKVIFDLLINWNSWSDFIYQPFELLSLLILFLSGDLLLFSWFFFSPQDMKRSSHKLVKEKLQDVMSVSIQTSLPLEMKHKFKGFVFWFNTNQ